MSSSLFSVKTTNFVRLYLDVGSLAGSQCYLAGDDDISLSSLEDEKQDSGDEQGDKDSDRPNQESTKSQPSMDDESDNVVDLTASPQVQQQQQQQPRQPFDSNAEVGIDEGDPQRQIKLQRLARIAKKFKKQYLQKSAQYKEQYTEKQKLSDRVRRAEDELCTIQEKMTEFERSRGLTELKLNESQLTLVRIRQERDSLQSLYSRLAEDKSRAEQRVRECHSHYKKELEAARAKSMSEVQEILEEHPKVVEENRVLKQRLQKLNRSLSRGADATTTTTTTTSRSSQLKDINKALRQMDQQLRSNPKATAPTIAAAAGSRSESSRADIWLDNHRKNQSGGGNRADNPFRSHARTPSGNPPNNTNRTHYRGKVAVMKENNGQYSGFASRMIKASQKAKRPPQAPPKGKKRLSITSLSLSSGNSKRMKSYTASRKDFFQRKP